MTAFHNSSTHSHPGEDPHQEEHGGHASSIPLYHGHEEKYLWAFALVFLTVLLFDVFKGEVVLAKRMVVREREHRRHRPPSLLTLLFSSGVLHSRIP